VATAAIKMQERVAPSRPSRLGTRRRRPRQADARPEAGGTRAGRKTGPPSLDTDKQLQTSVRDWMEAGLSEHDLYRRQISLHGELLGTYHKLWQDHAAAGNHEESVKWEKKWLRLYNCRNEWIGYRADCCKSMTQPVAVPIGCNDRLCPLCAWDRSKTARKRIKSMFDRLTHPAMITLTIPNKATIRKHDFKLFRQRISQLLKARKGWILGGVYSMETTYNRTEKTWHIHAHILVDLSDALPAKTEKIELAGQRVYAFTAMKLRLEFDWLRLWTAEWEKAAGPGASAMRRAGDTYLFERWVEQGREKKVKEWRGGAWRVIEGLTPADIEARKEWNAENRRVIDLRPVTDRDGAAREVLKYITKVADFGDLPEAVEPFSNAVKGARLIQTFGTWYGVKLDTPADAEHPDDWGELKCECGLNTWRRMGTFYRRDVEMDASGRWRLARAFDHNSAGTVPRPTIRALDEREE
jgi:hypothetical protein